MLAVCLADGCIVDCGNAQKTDADERCRAYSDSLGKVRFTDLVLIDEQPGTYVLDFILSGQDASEDTVSNLGPLALGLGLSMLSSDNFGLKPVFMPVPRRRVIAGVEATNDDMVVLTLVDATRSPLTVSTLPIFARLIPVNPATNDGAQMFARKRTACVTKEEYCTKVPQPGGCETLNPTDAKQCDEPNYPNTWLKSPFPITCCELSNCMQRLAPDGSQCCDCSRPECTLCQVPAEGIVEFNFDFRRVGTFNIEFKVKTLDGIGVHEYTDAGAVITVVAVWLSCRKHIPAVNPLT